MRYGLLLLALMLAAPAFAQSASQSAFEQGKALGSSNIQGTFNSINSGSAADKIPAYGTNPAETQYYQGGQGDLSGPGVTKMQSCATAAPDPDPIRRQECEAVNFLARNPQIRPQFNIDRKDPMFAKARDIGRNAENIFQSLGINGGTGASTQCTTKTETTPAQYTTETCSTVREIGQQQCTMGRIVNIDADANFQCEQTVNAYETLKCRRGSDVTCTGGGDGCDQGGIVPNSWAGDMAVSWFPDGAGNYILQFGTIGNNYWSGYGAVYDRTLTFEVRDVGLITKFSLTRVAFDDWLLVKLNGNLVYVGPYGGDRLEVVELCTFINEWGDCLYDMRVQYCATCYGWPELGTSWNFGLNIDLRPYLRNGSNTLFMRTIVAGLGEGAIQLTTRQKCPLQCSVSTRNECAALEARSQ